jgi:hypothetical protein
MTSKRVVDIGYSIVDILGRFMTGRRATIDLSAKVGGGGM